MKVTTTKTAASVAFDEVKERKKCSNDAALAVILGCSPSMISSMRKGALSFGRAMERKLIERGGMSERRIAAIRKDALHGARTGKNLIGRIDS